MKKLWLAMLLALVILPVSLAAQDYTVEAVNGLVKYESAPGVWTRVTPGMVLPEDVQLNTGLNSTVDLTLEETTVTIRAMQRGLLSELVTQAQSSGGFTVGSGPTLSTVNTDTQDRAGISTASTRAASSQEDVEWEDEEE